jgi:hypothetical protein
MSHNFSERVGQRIRTVLLLGRIVIVVSLLWDLSRPLMTGPNLIPAWHIKLINLVIALVTIPWLVCFRPYRRAHSILEGGARKSLCHLKRMGFGEDMLEGLSADEVDVLARQVPGYLAAHNSKLFRGVLTALANNDGLVSPGFGMFLNVLRTQLFLEQGCCPAHPDLQNLRVIYEGNLKDFVPARGAEK